MKFDCTLYHRTDKGNPKKLDSVEADVYLTDEWAEFAPRFANIQPGTYQLVHQAKAPSGRVYQVDAGEARVHSHRDTVTIVARLEL